MFISAVPSVISLKNIGGTETSLVTFKVVDQNGDPIAGRVVDFKLSTQVGGLSLSRSSAKTDATGIATTEVNAGTVATPVRITATTTDPVSQETFFTQSNALAVSTGIPDQDSFSLSVEQHNVEALNTDGVKIKVTIRAADRYNNPVPDGTSVSFRTEGGSIGSTCQLQDGTCTVDWTSQDPRPANGRSTIMAYAIGEESFIDINGNGEFDDGENFKDLNGNGIFDSGEPSTDIPEAFVDNNENGIREGTEDFVDFNNNSNYDPADGHFNGILCKIDTPENPRPGMCSPNQFTLNVFDSEVIIFSGNTPFIEDADVAIADGDSDQVVNFSGANDFVTVSFVVRDVNDQPMPAGTTISLTSDVGSTSGPSSFTVPDTIDASVAGNTYSFALKGPSGTDPSAGTVVLNITTPGGVKTSKILTASYTP